MFPTTEILREAERLWAAEFIRHGLTSRMLAIGTQKAITKPGFCPDLPEFIALCRPTAEDTGLPPVIEAYAEACRNSYPGAEVRWSHQAVYHAAQQVGMYELRSLDQKTSQPMFEHAYQETVTAILNGEQLPEIPKAIEDQTNAKKGINWKPTEADREKGRQCMSEIMGMLKRGKP